MIGFSVSCVVVADLFPLPFGQIVLKRRAGIELLHVLRFSRPGHSMHSAESATTAP